MFTMILSCPYDGRKLRYLINALLKSGVATEVKRLNYIQSYTLVDKTVKKQEEKILIIFGADQAKLAGFLAKQAPEAKILPQLTK